MVQEIIERLLIAILAIAVMGLTGCAGFPQMGDSRLTPAEQRYAQESNWLTQTLGRTDVQGAIAGAALGGIACALSGGSANQCAAIAAGGALAGYGAGRALDANRAAYAQKEQTLDQAIAAIQKDNEQTARMIVAQRVVVDEKRADLARIREAYAKNAGLLDVEKRALAAAERARDRQKAVSAELARREQDWTKRLTKAGVSQSEAQRIMAPAIQQRMQHEQISEVLESDINGTYKLFKRG